MPLDSVNFRLFLLGGFPQTLLGGLALNITVAVVAFAASFVVGHLLALGRMSRIAPLRWACTAYIELVRAVPLLIVMFWFFFSIPVLLQTTPSPLWTAFVALGAYASAYQAEYIRSGIRSVPQGEIEAARSLGVSTPALWLHVILPQAHRRMLPTYASYFTSVFKDTSALYLLGLVDLMQAGLITAERHPGRMLQVYLTMGCLFFIVCWTASRLARLLERRLAPPEHRADAPSTAEEPPPLPHPATRHVPEDRHAHA